MYVFGIDMPIMEILFFIMVFFGVVLIVNWLELRKLRLLILTEQADIYRFEKDIDDIKPQEKLKHEKALVSYINSAQIRGLKRNDIENILSNRGWPKVLINEAFKKVEIYKFNDDLTSLKPAEVKKHVNSLEDYIKLSLKKGHSKEQIQKTLSKKGWPIKLINDSFSKLAK